MEKEPDLLVSSQVNRTEMANNDNKNPLPAKTDKDNNGSSDSKENFDSIVKCLSESVLVEYLHDVLSFLLSDRREISFFNASHYVQLFLMNILKDLDNLNCQYFNKRCASMSKQIIKVLDTNKDVYKCVSGYETINGKHVLQFRKQSVPKTYEKTCSEGDACCTTSTFKSITENLHSDCPNHQTHKVSQAFKSRWLKTTLRFIKDDSKHNLKFPEMSPMEATYVYSLITRCKEQTDMAPDSYYTPLREAMQIFGLKYFFELTYIDTFPNGKMSLMLEKISKNIKSLIEGEKGTVNRFRNMKYIKQPKSRTSDEHRAGKVVSRLKSLKPESSNRLFNAFPATPREDDCCRVSEEPEFEPAARGADEPDRLSALVAKRNRKSKSAITIGFGEVVEVASVPQVSGQVSGVARASRRERSADKRTDKLLKAMSVPIKSDKAMKMMYGMGWDGGALGARGEGITEPIIPTLDIKSGAGFGHSSSPKRPPKKGAEAKKTAPEPEVSTITKIAEIKAPHPKKRNDFRMDVFGCIYDLITSEDTCMEIRLPNAVTKRDRGFIEHAVRAANERNNIGVNEPSGLNLWGKILDEMTSNPELHLKFAVSDDKKKVILSKVDTPYMSKKKKRKLQKKLSIQNIPSLPKGNKKIITNEFLRDLSESYIAPFAGAKVSPKATTGISFRVAVILHILEMVMNERQRTDIQFERMLNDAERDYVENTAVQVGIRKKRGGSKLENELLTEIKDHMDGYTLRVEFLNDQKSFILHKVEMKQSAKIPRDVSIATCSTDDNDKNVIFSDDSDAGQDDIDIDYNEDIALSNDENGSNDVSKALNAIIHKNKTDEQDDSLELVSDEDEKVLPDSTSEEENMPESKSDEGDLKDLEEDTLVEDKAVDMSIMEVHDAGKDAEVDNSKLDADYEEEVQFQNLKASIRSLIENSLVPKKQDQDYNKAKCDELKMDVQQFDKDVKLDVELNSKDVVKCNETKDCESIAIEKDSESNGSRKFEKLFEKYTAYYASDSSAMKVENDPLVNVLEKKLNDIDNNKEMNSPLHKVEHVNDGEGLKTTKKDSEKNTDQDRLTKDGKVLEKNIDIDLMQSSDKEKEEKTEVKEQLLDVLKTEIPKTEIAPATVLKENPVPKIMKVNQPKYVKRVYLIPDDYPVEEANTEFAKNIQIMISKQIEKTTELPLLKCYGVQDGALVYSCHSEKTLKWLENVCVSNYVKIIIPVKDEVRYKMSLKMNSFIDYTSAKLFKMLQLYNEGLPTENWIELGVEKGSDTLTFTVEIDEKSLKYIKECNFTLFAGIDQVQFNVMWN